MMKQITDTLLMVRPATFRMNEQTVVNNYYQTAGEVTKEDANQQAQQEFDTFVAQLKAVGVRVIVVEEDPTQDTPDALFPNNWVSFHEAGTVALYPMFAENRRKERRPEILEEIKKAGFLIEQTVDYTALEQEEKFLEGTGSLVLDRENRKAYCALSPRADKALLQKFCKDFNYEAIAFTAYQTVEGHRLPIYHTNVMMGIGVDFALVCLDCIDNPIERMQVKQQLTESGKILIPITEAQVDQFAGNILQVQGAQYTYLVMSSSAYNSLTKGQLAAIEQHTHILHSALTTIETLGGGSARCMMAEVFLPKK
ncbi:MAG: citrulline utilization hydrolase CtlX [Thermonemataceae bacterium]